MNRRRVLLPGSVLSSIANTSGRERRSPGRTFFFFRTPAARRRRGCAKCKRFVPFLHAAEILPVAFRLFNLRFFKQNKTAKHKRQRFRVQANKKKKGVKQPFETPGNSVTLSGHETVGADETGGIIPKRGKTVRMMAVFMTGRVEARKKR